ncbi:MAG: hypothetical protein ACP6IY_08010 [Promethearchaeia archaeon]
MKKTLFIFGAGASKADGAPLQNELMVEIFKILENFLENNDKIKTNYSSIDEELNKNSEILKNLKNLAEFLNSLYPFDKINDIYPSFEEIMGLFYFAKIRDENFIETSQIQLNKYFEMIIALISIILDERLRFINYQTYKKDSTIYQFINLLCNSDEKFYEKYSFLNINYDILLDNALFYLIDNNELNLEDNDKLKIDYCFNKFPCKCKNRIKLFKPHGSLNWLVCKSCHHVYYKFFKKVGTEFYIKSLKGMEYLKCEQCGSITSPLIVTPTFFKEFNNIVLRMILLNLEYHLRDVKNLVFIGYSFPEADVHLKYLFKRAQQFEGYDKIILVNKRSDKENNKENNEKNNKESDEKNYYYNVASSFPGVKIVDLTDEYNDGLNSETVEGISKSILENIEQ